MFGIFTSRKAAPVAPAPAAPPAEGAEHVLRRLEWTVIRRLDGLLQGDYRTLLRGAGLDLADLREYQHADDVRHIDWNVTARLQVPHVRLYTEDRELTAWFLVDLSGSVDFGSDATTKRALSEGFVAALARLFTRHGNRVGAILYRPAAARPLALLAPGAGRNQVLQILTRLRQPAAVAQPSPRGQAAPADPTRLGDLLTRAGALLRRRSLVFVLSDFISAPGWGPALGRLARRHEVLAVRLFDPLEMALPDIGLLTVQDAETGEQLQVDTQDAGFRQRFEALAARHEADLREQLASAGADVLELVTSDDLLDALLRWLALRRQRARAISGHRMPAALRSPSAVGRSLVQATA